MIELAPEEALHDVALALHARLNAPATAAERRVADLGLLAALLDEQPQDPDYLPRVKQEDYDEKRIQTGSSAPSAETLARRFGTWSRACVAAWTLQIDGTRGEAGANPWPGPFPGKRATAPYTRAECVSSIRACTDALRRRPSSWAYNAWRINRLARARSRGEAVRIASVGRILQVLAPERGDGDGWQIALSRAIPMRDAR